MNQKCNVLFLCWANSARSIMAEALLRELGDDKFEAFSAGLEPAAHVHPLALAQLRSNVTSIERLRPKSWQQYAHPTAQPMDLIVAMCAQSGALQPGLFPSNPVFCEWSFPDPVERRSSDAEQAKAFEQVFRQILRRVSVFVALPLASMKRTEQATAVNALKAGDLSEQTER